MEIWSLPLYSQHRCLSIHPQEDAEKYNPRVVMMVMMADFPIDAFKGHDPMCEPCRQQHQQARIPSTSESWDHQVKFGEPKKDSPTWPTYPRETSMSSMAIHGSASQVRTSTPTSRSTTQRTTVSCRGTRWRPWFVSQLTSLGSGQTTIGQISIRSLSCLNLCLELPAVNMSSIFPEMPNTFVWPDRPNMFASVWRRCMFHGRGYSIWFTVGCTTFALLASPDSLKRLLSTCTLWGCSFQTRSEHSWHAMPWTCTLVNSFLHQDILALP